MMMFHLSRFPKSFLGMPLHNRPPARPTEEPHNYSPVWNAEFQKTIHNNERGCNFEVAGKMETKDSIGTRAYDLHEWYPILILCTT